MHVKGVSNATASSIIRVSLSKTIASRAWPRLTSVVYNLLPKENQCTSRVGMHALLPSGGYDSARHHQLQIGSG